MRKRVVIESPYNGNIEEVIRNIKYARACVRDSLEKGESPFASHLIYTQPGILDDNIPEERNWGIEAGFDLTRDFELVAFYCDLGITDGMEKRIKEERKKHKKEIEKRYLGNNWEDKFNERFNRHYHRHLF